MPFRVQAKSKYLLSVKELSLKILSVKLVVTFIALFFIASCSDNSKPVETKSDETTAEAS